MSKKKKRRCPFVSPEAGNMRKGLTFEISTPSFYMQMVDGHLVKFEDHANSALPSAKIERKPDWFRLIAAATTLEFESGKVQRFESIFEDCGLRGVRVS